MNSGAWHSRGGALIGARRFGRRGESSSRRGRRAVGLAAAVLTLGLAGGAAATTGLALAADDAGAAELSLRAASVRSALGSALQRYADTMLDVSAIATTTTLPDTAARLASSALSDTVARIAGERLPGAHEVLVVAGDRTVLAQHAADGSALAVVATLSPAPELSQAMALATRHGRLVAGAAHVLAADAGLPAAQRQQAFELVAPLRDRPGWVIVSVRASDFLDQTLRAAGMTGVRVTLTEMARPVAAWPVVGPPPGDKSRNVALGLAGTTWQAIVRPTTPLVGTGLAAAAPATMIGAALLSVVLAVLVLRMSPAAATAPATEPTSEPNELAGFAATASEHLHTPLHTIAGFTEILLEDAPGLDEEARGFVRRIGGATQRMLGVVDELVAYATAGDAALKPEPIEATLLALDVAAAHLPGPSIEIGELPAIAGDAALLRQVLDQLITNAARFVRHGADARIEVGARPLGAGDHPASGQQSGQPHRPGWWRIEVADRGIGVPEEQRSRIFAPFHRAPAAEGYPGTGLGLAVCARIVALHGGEIGVDTNPGGGSIFWFTVAGAELTTAQPALSRPGDAP